MTDKPQVFCFTYAGGAASFFDLMAGDLRSAEWIPLEYAGHGERRKEPFYGDFKELADDLLPRIMAARNSQPYALFGYSMGSVAAAEILGRILTEGKTEPPKCVFLAAHEPHGKAELAGFDPGKKHEWVKERTLRFGGIPEKLLNNPAFWRMYLPVFRADYEMIWKYDFGKLDLRTEIPAEIFYSQEDTPLAEMEKWRRYFTGECEFHRYEGNHFFILEHHREMAGVLRRRLL